MGVEEPHIPGRGVVPNADLLPKILLPPPKVLVVEGGWPKTDVVVVLAGAVGCPNPLVGVVPEPNALVPPENAPKPVAGLDALNALVEGGLFPNVPGIYSVKKCESWE